MRKMALAVIVLTLCSAGVPEAADLPSRVQPTAAADNQAPVADVIADTMTTTDNQAVFEGRVRNITVSRTTYYTNIDVQIDGKIGSYNSTKLLDPFRIVVDIPGVDQGTAAPEIPVGSPQVKTVRVFRRNNALRMIVEPPEDRVVPFLVNLEGSRLVLSVGGGQEEKAAAPGSQVPARSQAAAGNRPAVAETGKKKANPPGQASSKRPVYLSMDFTDVDLPVLIKFISEQTKKNFIFDERVKGKITIISPRRISMDEAYNVFLSVLHVKGFATVEQENTIKIVPLREIKQEDLPTETGRGEEPGSRFITRLIPLQFVDVAGIVTLLTPLISKNGLLTSFAPSNTLILIDSRSNIDKVVRILEHIDREGTGTTMRIFSLTNATVTEIAKTLDLLYKATAAPKAAARRGRATPAAPRGIGPKFIPDTRTNILIVVAGQEAMADIEDLIVKLDIPTPENTGKINVYYLENADAEEVAKVLSSLTERQPATPQAKRQATIKGIISAELEGGVKITADKATNSLIIIASLNDYQTLVDVIKKLDIRRRQVYVEALVMEIGLDNARDVGVEFRAAAEIGDDGAVLGGTNFDFQGNLSELLLGLASGNPLLFSGSGLIAAGIAGNVTLPDGTEVPAITAVLRAAQTRDNINILSTPHLLTMDNKEAEIIVAENIPFITSQSRDSTNLANVINTVEREDVGIILRFTPRINESNFVSLEIYQESSAVKETSLLVVSEVGPTTTKRSARTSVLVKTGETVVLGGMMQETVNNFETKVPLLGSIPILGNLFKFSSVSRKKTNLLIFLTPHIIKTPEDMGRVTTDHRSKMDKFIEQHKEEVEDLLPESDSAEELW
ncbi:MAG: type II secretion system secretin GspD [Deltaproteobacteria bacterium]|nr:type II secretion system secretin GspD [Deltaproteobacteria bacterium]